MRSLALFIFLLTACTAEAADREIAFVQQQAGHLDFVSIVQSADKSLAIVHRFSAKPSERVRPITRDQFESVWAAFTGPEVSRFAFAASRSDSMSDPHYYTISTQGAKKPISLRIPIDAKLPKPVADAVAQIRAWIEEKG